jgi:hypothetical protein
MKIAVRTDQQILVLKINCGDVAHQIPDVSAYSEFVDLSNVDRDAHSQFQYNPAKRD